MRRRRPREAGFTLTEVSIAMGLSSVTSYLVLKMIVLTFGTYHTGEALMGHQEALDRASRVLAREIRQADEATLLASGSSVVFQVPEDLDGDGTVLDAYGDLEFGGAIAFRHTDGRLLREEDRNGNGAIEDVVPGERVVVANGVDGVTFTQEPEGVRVTLVLDGGDPGMAPETVESWIPTRNTTASS